MNDKPTILIGPEPSKNPLNSGSWKWFGVDLALELSKYYNIITQKTRDDIKKADCYVVIKSLEFLKKIQDSGKNNTIYVPVDKLRHATELKLCAKHAALITVLNNQNLYETHFKNAKNNHYAQYIPHHIKYFYDGHSYEERESFIFWQGMQGNYVYVKEYLNQNFIEENIRFAISGKERDPNKYWGTLDYVQWVDGDDYDRIHYPWIEERHAAFMQTCSGFLDIKGTDFHQRYKPPTKVLDAIASGVPTAINDCGVRDFMASLGMNLAYPTDTEYWFSREYFDLTQQWKEIIRRDFHVEKVALQYKEAIDFVVGVK